MILTSKEAEELYKKGVCIRGISTYGCACDYDVITIRQELKEEVVKELKNMKLKKSWCKKTNYSEDCMHTMASYNTALTEAIEKVKNLGEKPCPDDCGKTTHELCTHGPRKEHCAHCNYE